MIDTHLLETFVTVVQTGSVSQTADILFRSQPAISHRIKELESILGIALFERVGRNLQPTAAAMEFYDESLELVNRLRELPSFANRYRDEVSGTLTIGLLPTLGRHYLFDAITTMMERYPDLKIVFRFAISDDLVSALRMAEVDLIVGVGDVPKGSISVEEIGSVDIVAVMSPSLRQTLGKKMTLSALRDLRYLAWRGPRDSSFETIDRYAIKHKLVDERTAEIPHIETLRALAVASVGFALLPRYVCLEEFESGSLVFDKPPRFSTTFPIFVGTRLNQVATPAAHVFRDLITTTSKT